MGTRKGKKEGGKTKTEYRKKLLRWLSFALGMMIVSQGILLWNKSNIHWIDGRYTEVSLSASSNLIIVVDSKTGLAGAINMKGETVIPLENNVFDPWDGSLIDGLHQDGNLFWVNKENKVGIVNEKNEQVIPCEYGYLKKTQENQFMAGTGEISSAVTGGGVYAYKKYGVITESGDVLIPLQYDFLEILDDGRYKGIIEENTRKVTRTFYSNGELEKEEIEEDEPDPEPESEITAEEENDDIPKDETEAESDDAAGKDTQGESQGTSGEESGEGDAEREDSEIEDYHGPAADYEVVNHYIEGQNTKLHLEGTKCMLEDEYGNVLVEFEGERNLDTMPEFEKQGKLIIDTGAKFYRVYNASSGLLLCDVKKEANCIITDHLLVYEQAAEYIVKNFNDTELFRTERGAEDQFMNSPDERARFVFRNSYFVYQGDQGRTLIMNSGVVITEGLDSISFNDDNNNKEKAEDKIFICERDAKYAAFNAAGDKILDFLYENIEFFNGHKNGLRVTQDQSHVGIVDYTGKVIIPLEYDSVGYGSYIEEADNTSIVEYELLNSARDSYYGKTGNNIYYLDNDGNKAEEVRYVKTIEKGRDLNDYLFFGRPTEMPKEYRTTGNLLVMDNAYSDSLGFGRSDAYKKVENNKVQFLLVDESNERIGVHEYYFGDFTLMGYQHLIWYIWMISSRMAMILLIGLLLFVLPFEELSDRFYFWRKERKSRRKKN